MVWYLEYFITSQDLKKAFLARKLPVGISKNRFLSHPILSIERDCFRSWMKIPPSSNTLMPPKKRRKWKKVSFVANLSVWKKIRSGFLDLFFPRVFPFCTISFHFEKGKKSYSPKCNSSAVKEPETLALLQGVCLLSKHPKPSWGLR